MPEPRDPDSEPTVVVPASVDDGTELEVDVAAFLPDPDPEPIDAGQLSEDLDRVDAALAALDAKTYGQDPQTGDLISDEVLAADPTRLS